MLLKQMVFRVLIIVSFIVVGNIDNAFADVNCPTNSTYNGSECVCDSGYTKTSHVYDFNVKNPTYSYSGSTFTAEATNIGTIYGESLGWNKGTGSIDASVPAGTYTGKNCWCRIVAPFETNWTYSGGAVAPSSTIPEGSDIWFDECSKKCAGKTYSATIHSFYGNNILNNGEICVKNATPSCNSGYYWDDVSQECKYDYELECNNRGGYYYWDTSSHTCRYNYESECDARGEDYIWNNEKQECETTEFICSSDKYLRIGDNESDKMCLSENQATHPALAVGVAGNVYYIPLSYTDSYINENSRKKMKILYNGNIYNAHDASVE
jgi:hypothetical protein